MTPSSRPLAFVLPWYGPDLLGGAETNARHLAEHLRARGLPVEVWTTCAGGLGSDWNKNDHRPGRTVVNGVPVIRFPVSPVRRDQYGAIHRRLARGRRVTPEQEARFLTQSIRSRALCEHIASHPEHLCFFTPYLYGTTYWGAYVAPERSFLIPCLHDEGFAHLVAMRQLFRAVRGVLCNTPAEMRLAGRLYGLCPERMAVVGVGISVRQRGDARDARAFRKRYSITAPFMLYAGRKSPAKNVPLLLNYFRRYRQRRKTALELALIGGGRVSIPSDCRRVVHDLGFLSPQDKQNAFAAATLFCLPSVQESFSIVLMEAWVQETAALVNARCDVTREHCQKSQGGLYFNDYQEFEATLDLLLADPSLRRRLGSNGRRYVAQNYAWERVTGRFVEAVHG